MKKVVIIAVFLISILSLLSLVSASGIDSEIQKLTHYSEEYETGNINYIQFLVYVGSSRQKTNEILGATDMQFGGLLKAEQLRSVLGEPTEETKWVWVENENNEKRLDSGVPVWKKIIFDGNKIQLRLNAWPSIFKKENEETLIYRLDLAIDFKKPQQQFDISEKISHIKTLAEAFNINPTSENAENLARESVDAEKTFEAFYRQNQGVCEDIMKSIFGTENQRQTQKLLVQEIILQKGDNFEVVARLEMCDECEWNWINFNVWLEGRGPGFRMPKEQQGDMPSPEDFKSLNDEQFKTEFKTLIEQFKQLTSEKKFGEAISLNGKINAINWAWNDKSNNIWPEIDKIFQEKKSGWNAEQFSEYDWKEEEKERKELEQSMRKANYEKRKQFYLDLFSEYEKKEYFFTQTEFEKRLVEEFKEFGEEICHNEKDDNNNNQIDCSDNLCAGKICGKENAIIQQGNETFEVMKDLFCIAGICQKREEIIQPPIVAICGNHICEPEEREGNCTEDCTICQAHEPLECAGRVIFKGRDKNSCSLEPICINETDFCQVNEDCIQPLCGRAECIESRCKVVELEECKETQCVDGEEKIQNCENGESIVVEVCIDGMWRGTEFKCEIIPEPIQPPGNITTPAEPPEEIIQPEPIVGDECSVREDCGGENDVCSNGRCVTIPEAIPIEPALPTPPPEQPPAEQPPMEQPPEQPPAELPEQPPALDQQPTPEPVPEPSPISQPEPLQEPTPVSETPITATIISALKGITGKITGFLINAFSVEGEQSQEQPPEQPQPPPQETPEQPPAELPEQPPEQPPAELPEQPPMEQPPEQPPQQEQPPIPEPIQERPEPSQEKFKEQEEREKPKEEKGVFKVGGICRQSQQKTEAFIFFDGWGEPFEQIQRVKYKYYSGGEADWCKQEFENFKKQRQEFEKGFNEEFVKWFFEKYLANSAEDWEQHVSGIFEVYWKNIDTLMQMYGRMSCLDLEKLEDYQLISVKYDTEYGSLEYWEEIQSVKMPWMGIDKEIEVISPYMKIWIFPPKSFIIYEMKKSMKEHEFPGPPESKVERKREEGPTAEEREMIKQDEKVMKQIKKVVEKYNGEMDVVVQFKDYETNETVFNLYAQINENDIVKVKPMLPSEIPAQDVRVEVDFEDVYNMIYTIEKEMRGAEMQTPPWDRKSRIGSRIKEIKNGVKMWFKIRDLMNSAKFEPESAKGDIVKLFKTFFSMKEKEGKMQPPGMEEMTESEKEKIKEELEGEIWESKGKLTGEIIAGG